MAAEAPLIRNYRPGDIPAMSGIWARCFADPPELISDFLAALPDFGGAVVAELGGQIVGAAYALTGMELSNGSGRAPVLGYIYAVAVDESARRRGAGGALTLAAAELARRREAEIICVQPASAELFGWYEKLLGTKCALRRSKKNIKSEAAELTMPLSSTEYMLWREKLLRDMPHARLSNHCLEAQRKMLSHCGGGFFAAESGIAAVSVEDGTAVIRELLCADECREDAAAASVAAALGCGSALLYAADPNGEPYMAADVPFPEKFVWNLSFD